MTDRAISPPPDDRPVDAATGLPFSRLVHDIAGEGSRAWEVHGRARQLQAQGRDVILLSVGDPDFDTPRAVVDAAIASLRAGRTHYTAMTGLPELRQAIAQRHGALRGVSVDADQITVVSGAQNALFSTLLCLAQPGDEVIAPEPMYVTYEAVIGASGARQVPVSLRGDHGFHLDPADIEAAVTPRSRVVLINFPNNPTGATITADELAGLAEVCKRHNLWLVSDEVYATLTYDGPHLSPAALPGMAERTVVLDSLSKSHAMSGWRLGWVVAPPSLVPHLANLALCMLYGCPPFVQDAAVVALTTEFDEIAAMRAAFRERRDRVVERINAMPRLAYHPPEGGMFAMVDARDTGLSAVDFAFRLVESEGVSLLPGDAFGPSATGYLRLSLTAPIAVLDQACDRIERFVRALNR